MQHAFTVLLDFYSNTLSLMSAHVDCGGTCVLCIINVFKVYTINHAKSCSSKHKTRSGPNAKSKAVISSIELINF